MQISFIVITSFLFIFNWFDLVVKHDKSEVFYFLESTKNIYSLPLDLRSLKSSLLHLKDMWQYLGFFFDKKLSFYQHTHHYTNKALFMIKDMKILGNSNRELSPIHKQLLYRTCVFFIILYRFQLWYFKEVPLYQSFKELKKMQNVVATTRYKVQ